MREYYWIRLFVYLGCFAFALYGMNALDFKRILKSSKAAQSWILWIMTAMSLAYLAGTFLLEIRR